MMATIRLSYWPFPSIPTEGGEDNTPLESALHTRTGCGNQSHTQTEHHVSDRAEVEVKAPVWRIYWQKWNRVFIIMLSFVHNHLKIRTVALLE